MSSKNKKLLFCYVIYVVLFIALALWPPNRNQMFYRPSIIMSLYYSNLFVPFIANTILAIYFYKKG